MPQTIKVLLVEDVESKAELILNLLKKCKKAEYIITHARSLKEGVSYIGKIFFDIMLLDLMLPNSQGIASFKRMNEACAEIPIVIVSDHRDIAFKAVREGAQDYLLKNEITSDNLWRAIRYAMERKEFEKERYLLLKKYQELVKHAPAAIYQIDFLKDKFVRVNDVMCQYTGYTEDELLQMSPKELLSKESYDLFLDRLNKIANGEKIDPNVEYQIKTKNGDILWVFITANFIKSKTGKAIGANVIGVDITEKKNLEIKLKEAEDVWNSIMENGIKDIQEEIIDIKANRSRITEIFSYYTQR